MTNGEKYKTAQERAKAFDKYCDERSRSDPGCSVDGCRRCLLAWLDLEAEEEKPETIDDIVKELRSEPLAEGGAKPWLHYLADRIIAAHNRVAKAVRESEGK